MFTMPGYKIIKTIGIGGMATVYLAEDDKLGRRVAVKILHQHLSSDENLRQRFFNEAKIMAVLDHPSIIRVITYEEFDSKFAIVMDFIEGRSLDEMMALESGPIPYERALPMIKDLLAGVQYAHEKDVIHRDLKPSNVLVSSAGKVKIADFGIARIMGASRMTKTGTQMGSLSYMSPEQVKGERTDKLTDIYSLGMTLYEMLAGRLPFDQKEDTTEFAIMSYIVNQEMIDPREFYPHIPEWLVSIIKKATAKDKKNRFQSCNEFIQAIEKEEVLEASIQEVTHEEVKELVTTQIAEPPTVSDYSVLSTASGHKKDQSNSIKTTVIVVAAVAIIVLLVVNISNSGSRSPRQYNQYTSSSSNNSEDVVLEEVVEVEELEEVVEEVVIQFTDISDPRPSSSSSRPVPYFYTTDIPLQAYRNEPFEFTIFATNRGDPVDKGSITVTFTGAPRLAILESDALFDNQVLIAEGENVCYINESTGAINSSCTAYNVSAEAYYDANRTWRSTIDHYLRVRVTPTRRGNMQIQVRNTINYERDYANSNGLQRFYTWPNNSYSDGTDQQGLRVSIINVEVN